MLILSRVCAQFRDAAGNVLFTISPENMLSFVEAPDAIRQDPLFQMLVDDGSLEASLTPARKKQLEQEPTVGTEASGKRKSAKSIQAETSEHEKTEEAASPLP